MKHAKGFALKIQHARELIARVEKSLGHKLTHHRVDLLLDNNVCHTSEQARAVLRAVERTS